ncbi:MAG: hypothetical protein AAFV53_08880 [Myxococcota bacterium]
MLDEVSLRRVKDVLQQVRRRIILRQEGLSRKSILQRPLQTLRTEIAGLAGSGHQTEKLKYVLSSLEAYRDLAPAAEQGFSAQRILKPSLDDLEAVSEALSYWEENKLSQAASEFHSDLQNLYELLPDIVLEDEAVLEVEAGEWVKKIDQLLDDLHDLEHKLTLIAPLSGRIEEVWWSESHSLQPEHQYVSKTFQRDGALLVLWMTRQDPSDDLLLEKNAMLWRQIRRELSDVGALRLRPYKGPSAIGHRDPKRLLLQIEPRPRAMIEPWTRKPSEEDERSAVDVAEAPRRSLRLTYDKKLLDEEEGVLLDEAPWLPDDERDRLFPIDTIGYFFIPSSTQEDLVQIDLLSFLLRLTWLTCTHIPLTGTQNLERLGYRMVVLGARMEWLELPLLPEMATWAVTSPTLRLKTYCLEVVEQMFKDPVTRNTVMVDPILLQRHSAAQDWFRETWRLPTGHRDLLQEGKGEGWFASSPVFNGRPGWVERLELSALEPKNPVIFPADETPKFETFSRVQRHERRRSARIRPSRPIFCHLRLPSSGPNTPQRIEETFQAYLVDWGRNACRIYLPMQDKPDAEECANKLRRWFNRADRFHCAQLLVREGIRPLWPYPDTLRSDGSVAEPTDPPWPVVAAVRPLQDDRKGLAITVKLEKYPHDKQGEDSDVRSANVELRLEFVGQERWKK